MSFLGYRDIICVSISSLIDTTKSDCTDLTTRIVRADDDDDDDDDYTKIPH